MSPYLLTLVTSQILLFNYPDNWRSFKFYPESLLPSMYPETEVRSRLKYVKRIRINFPRFAIYDSFLKPATNSLFLRKPFAIFKYHRLVFGEAEILRASIHSTKEGVFHSSKIQTSGMNNNETIPNWDTSPGKLPLFAAATLSRL